MNIKIGHDMYPVLPLRDLVMFPKMIVPLFVGRDKSVKALERATVTGSVLLVAQKDPNKDNPKFKEIYKVGVLAKILQLMKLQDSTIKILVEGVNRVKVLKYEVEDSCLIAEVTSFEDVFYDNSTKEAVAIRRSLFEKFFEYVKINKRISEEVVSNINKIADDAAFCDAISSHLLLPVEKKQVLLESNNVGKRLERLLIFINAEIELLKAENRIKTRVRNQIEKNQKDYYLNEQLKAIHKELGEEDFKEEFNDIVKKIKRTKLSKEARKRAESELKKLRMMNPISSEATVIRNYLDWLLTIPWQIFSPIKKDLEAAAELLDQQHYGLEKVKERILEYLAVHLRTDDLNSPILCLVGPPGVGKTSLAKSIAETTGRSFVKISLGGLRDEAEIKGHRRTYIGARPGKLIQGLKKTKTSNPLMLLDEIDKMGHDFRGDPASALLDILDPEQNKTFNDHYLEEDYDLSKVMFVATANSMDLPRPLIDRLEVIRLSGYTEDEKLEIAKRHLIPKQSKAHGLRENEILWDDSAILKIVRHYTHEAGVRSLDREIAKVIRKVVRKSMSSDDKAFQVRVDENNIKDFLGPIKHTIGETTEGSRVGITNGLAYTEAGGDLLAIEALVFQGKGEMKITGKLGDVMKESIQAAVSYVRFNAVEFGIKPEIFKDVDVHVHVPEGATPKDGPSAGVGMCISIASALTGIPVRNDVAVTGEMTLSGKVLAIGGLKEKLLAALRGGIKTVMIPNENVRDLEEVPEKVKSCMKIVPISSLKEALDIALTEPFKQNNPSGDMGNLISAQTPHHMEEVSISSH